MKTRKLRELNVSAIGLGCMGFSHGYGPAPERNESIRLIRRAFEMGCNFFDTAEGYGAGDNESIVGEALKPLRQKVIVATKLHIPDDSDKSLKMVISEHLEASLKRLHTDCIDLYYQHRVNKNIPVEEVAQCMGELIREGKIRGWGQSQATEQELRRAHAVTPLTAIQSEYSMMERMFEKDVIPACGELNIGFVPFSPLASGFLSGKHHAQSQFTGDDVRKGITRYTKENIQANQPLLDLLNQFAGQKQATAAQISLAWMLHNNDFIVPIPGMRSEARFSENFASAGIELSEAEFQRIEDALSQVEIHGNRTDEDIAKLYK
ncbi:aryl-alcohol dehydrogenase-like predicted oxidoreductase [Erwinia toletana]|uniref:Aryl-alcohol dehydrogenase-like predicted oxidoreductase n=1 Tax=Winslowiella toletana TaxID=92490 RepID=A0ABS4PFS0_9GAMM|nr:aldo/keto reductase [Winslowiella toletana]MBP2170758.1 aryl-alcohol dehydrogenase-like predicted oxidoreductase [Winslowiella toletana]